MRLIDAIDRSGEIRAHVLNVYDRPACGGRLLQTQPAADNPLCRRCARTRLYRQQAAQEVGR